MLGSRNAEGEYAFTDEDMGIYGLDAPSQSRRMRLNVGEMERVASGVVGGLLAVSGASMLARGHLISGSAFGVAGALMAYRSASGHCPVYEHVGADDTELDGGPWSRALELRESIAVHRPPSELYAYWRNLENLPRIMHYLERVDVIDARRSRWTAKGPRDHAVSWEAEITLDDPDERIAWTSLAGSQIETTGSVQFIPMRDNDTLVRVAMIVHPPGGALGAAVAKVFGRDPSRMLKRDLRRFRATMEAGGMPSTGHQPRGES